MPPKAHKREDGRFQKSIKLGYQDNGKPKKKVFYGKSQKEADEKCADFMELWKKGIVIENANITVRELAQLWVKTYRSNKTYSTNDMYDRIVNKHIVTSEIGDYYIKNLKAIHLQKLLNDKAASGLTRTTEQIYMIIKQLIAYAVDEDYIVKDISKKLIKPTVKHEKRRALKPYEKDIIKYAELDDKLRVFVDLLQYAGLRRGEALGLSKLDINTKDHVISIKNQVTFEDNTGVFKNYTKTDAGARVVPIPDDLKKSLYPYLDNLKSVNDQGIDIINPFLFTNKDGSYVSKSGFDKMWKRIYDELSLLDKDFEWITPHMLRHTYCTMLYYAGVDLKRAQYLMGHETIQMTLEIYTHLDHENHDEIQKINTYLSKKNDDNQNNGSQKVVNSENGQN